MPRNLEVSLIHLPGLAPERAKNENSIQCEQDRGGDLDEALVSSSFRRNPRIEFHASVKSGENPQSFGRRRELAKDEGIPLGRRITFPVVFGIRNRNLIPYRIEEPLVRLVLGRNLRKAERAGTL